MLICSLSSLLTKVPNQRGVHPTSFTFLYNYQLHLHFYESSWNKFVTFLSAICLFNCLIYCYFLKFLLSSYLFNSDDIFNQNSTFEKFPIFLIPWNLLKVYLQLMIDLISNVSVHCYMTFNPTLFSCCFLRFFSANH